MDVFVPLSKANEIRSYPYEYWDFLFDTQVDYDKVRLGITKQIEREERRERKEKAVQKIEESIRREEKMSKEQKLWRELYTKLGILPIIEEGFTFKQYADQVYERYREAGVNMNVKMLAATGVLALAMQDGKPLAFQPNEVQSLRLQVKQKDAQLAQRELQLTQQALTNAQEKFQKALKELTDEGEAIKKANNWDAKVTMNPDTLAFSLPKEEKK